MRRRASKPRRVESLKMGGEGHTLLRPKKRRRKTENGKGIRMIKKGKPTKTSPKITFINVDVWKIKYSRLEKKRGNNTKGSWRKKWPGARKLAL